MEQLPADLKLEVDCMLGITGTHMTVYVSTLRKMVTVYPGHPCAGMPRRAKLHLTD